MIEFGRIMKQARIAKMITLKELGKHLDKKISYLSDVECGRKQPPCEEVVRSIEKFLGIEKEKLVHIAKAARTMPQQIKQKIATNPRLANILLRAEQDLTDDQYDELIKHIEQITSASSNSSIGK